MSIVFSTAGIPEDFKNSGLKYPADLPRYLKSLNLNGFELQCGRGIRASSEVVSLFSKGKEFHGLSLSIHSPYFISISSTEKETRLKSINYILETGRLAKKIGAHRIVVHSGSCSKISREDALELAVDTIKKARDTLDEQGLENISICLETMGKINQLGTLEEVLTLCNIDERMIPCIDFGHLNARTFGGLKDRADYKLVFDKIENTLGKKRAENIHIHFSKIEYTSPGGEKKHLTFKDDIFGPSYEPMLDEIISRGLTPFIICESSGTQGEDCAEMSAYYFNQNQ